MATRSISWLAFLPAVTFLFFWSCTGNVERSRLLSNLRVELDPSPASVEAGQPFSLRWRLHNLGGSAVDLCAQSETIVLRSSQGTQTPLLLRSTIDGCSSIHLARDESKDYVSTALVFPTVPSGRATILARIELRIELGQWYRPSHLLPLSAEREVEVTRSGSSGS